MTRKHIHDFIAHAKTGNKQHQLNGKTLQALLDKYASLDKVEEDMWTTFHNDACRTMHQRKDGTEVGRDRWKHVEERYKKGLYTDKH